MNPTHLCRKCDKPIYSDPLNSGYWRWLDGKRLHQFFEEVPVNWDGSRNLHEPGQRISRRPKFAVRRG